MVELTETIDVHDNTRPHFNFDNSFARSLEGFFKHCQSETAVAPKMLQFNHALAKELGLDRPGMAPRASGEAWKPKDTGKKRRKS